mmetsp:Transcript_53005/g.102321  ORF Transcript_53005/g.102321 Transcript_53005/m.102321 type:complete len:254 (+) Transcript_53005:30-791(+)
MAGTFLVAGATSTGAALARRLVTRGHRVHLTGRNTESLSALASSLGSSASWSQANVLEDGAGARIAKDALAAAAAGGSELRGLAYCVGDIPLKSIRAVKRDEFLKTYHLHCWGALEMVQAILPALQKTKVAGGSSVVLFSSLAVAQGFPMHAAIAAAKGGVEGLSVSLAAELAPKVRVNCIRPGLTKSSISAKLLKDETAEKKMGEINPLPRVGTPDDVAALAAFLLTEDSSWMTGQIIGVDGGRSALRHKSQ